MNCLKFESRSNMQDYDSGSCIETPNKSNKIY